MEQSGKIKYYVSNTEHIVYVTGAEYTRAEFEVAFPNLTFVEFV